jgi:hypothetical protein
MGQDQLWADEVAYLPEGASSAAAKRQTTMDDHHNMQLVAAVPESVGELVVGRRNSAAVAATQHANATVTGTVVAAVVHDDVAVD